MADQSTSEAETSQDVSEIDAAPAAIVSTEPLPKFVISGMTKS